MTDFAALDTWRKLHGDPSNINGLLIGEVDHLLAYVIQICAEEELFRYFSVALVREMLAWTISEDGLNKTAAMVDLAEKMVRTPAIRKRLDELAGIEV